ncbi:unnamed protein product [Rotaria sp. Silwood2]|nr:unnamed protein product [Rotaria sp. Silwood2]CAF3084176.1 unnamed protein product [Rotaria sp. Silwood2]CAF4186148.1 unnamed protein product [Rotaria sp. Silwood2]CAF4277959.1 unnamed protein product [Rotaria sp. Silwood2]CAF4477386.1 unnamed protein product [Rotaria sp. Silwood2]
MGSFGSALQSAVGYVSSLFTKNNAGSPASSRPKMATYSPTSKSSFVSSVAHQESVQINTVATSDSQLQKQLQIDWPTDEQELISRFIELQKYDGLWILTDSDIKQLTGKSLADFSSLTVDSIENSYRNSVTTTVLVIVLLETRCASNKTLWQALSNKACTRIKALLGEDETKLQQLLKHIRDQLLSASI